MIKPEKTINGTKWIETIQINAEERATLEDQYGIDEDIIEYVTDNDESTNYVYDINEDDQLFIFLAPYALDKDALRYITQPFGMLLHKGVLFTFNQSHIPEVNTALYLALDNPEVKSVDAFILETLFTVVDSFIPISRGITKKRNYLDKMLNRKTKNSDLVSLSYLQQTLTFCPARSKPISVNSIVCQRPILVSVLTKIKLIYSKTCKLKENRSNGCLRLKPKSLTESIIPSTALLITT